jgi:hypothetical protein
VNPARRKEVPRPRPVAVAPVPASPAPPLGRDPWAWAALAGVVPLVAHSLGAPLGEPVADDFDFLHRALLEGTRTLLDGGGSLAFWRPLSHQLYYVAFGRLILAHPGMVAALHVLLFAVATLLLYRVARPAFTGPLAAAVAVFPLLADSTRTHVAWPSEFVDLGLFFFSVVALHEASRRRLPTALAALAAALACKEMAIITAAAMPFLPGPSRRSERVRWALACGGVVSIWAATYLWVRHHAGLTLPHNLENDAALLATPLAARLTWALRGNLRAIMSLDEVAGPRDLPAMAAVGALLVAVLAIALLRRGATRARIAPALPWVAWGLAWFLVSTAALVSIFPLWQPDRSQYASVGLGFAVAAAIGAVQPWLVAGALALRLGVFAACPGPAVTVSTLPPEAGAFMDFPRLSRLQLLMREIRIALRARYPALPAGSTVVQQNLPHGAEWAFGGDHALQVWYRDPTLRWMRFERFRANPAQEIATIVEFQPGCSPEVALVDPAAMRALIEGYEHLAAHRWAESVTSFDRASSLQRDSAAVVFRTVLASRRALDLDRLGRAREAEAEGRLAVRLSPLDPDSRYVLALALGDVRRFAEADAQLDTLLHLSPGDTDAVALRARIRSASATTAR